MQNLSKASLLSRATNFVTNYANKKVTTYQTASFSGILEIDSSNQVVLNSSDCSVQLVLDKDKLEKETNAKPKSSKEG